jgi:hypothetical protein
MDTLDEYRDLLETIPPHERLIERLADALAEQRGRAKIVLRGPVIMQVLRKTGDRKTAGVDSPTKALSLTLR